VALLEDPQSVRIWTVGFSAWQFLVSSFTRELTLEPGNTASGARHPMAIRGIRGLASDGEVWYIHPGRRPAFNLCASIPLIHLVLAQTLHLLLERNVPCSLDPLVLGVPASLRFCPLSVLSRLYNVRRKTIRFGTSCLLILLYPPPITLRSRTRSVTPSSDYALRS